MPDLGYSDELAFHRDPTATDLLSGGNDRTQLMVNYLEKRIVSTICRSVVRRPTR